MTSELKSMFGEKIPEQTNQLQQNTQKDLEKKQKDYMKKQTGMKRELIKLIGGVPSIVERTTKTLIGSAASNEGLLNVFRGTGKVLMSPVAPTNSLVAATNSVGAKAGDAKSNAFNAVGGVIGGIMGN